MQPKKMTVIACIILFIMILSFSIRASASTDSEKSWVYTNETGFNVPWGKSYILPGNYSLLVTDVDRSFTGISVEVRDPNKALIVRSPLFINNATLLNESDDLLLRDDILFVSPDIIIRFKEACCDFFEKGEVNVAFGLFSVKTPAISVNVSSVEEPDEPGVFNVSFYLENTGGMPAGDPILDVAIPQELKIKDYQVWNKELIIKNNYIHVKYPRTLKLKRGEKTETVWLKIDTPSLPDAVSYTLFFNMTGMDITRNRHVYTNATFNLTNRAYVFCNKYLSVLRDLDEKINFSEDKNKENKIHLNEKLVMSISCFNIGTRNVRITINESVPPDFIMDPYREINGTFEFPPGSNKAITYGMYAARPGDFKLGISEGTMHYQGKNYPIPINLSATTSLNYSGKTYSIVLGKDQMVSVYGPYVRLTKSVRPDSIEPGKSLNVSILVENMNDNHYHAAYTRIRDTLPEGGELITGSLEGEMILQPGDTGYLNYTIRLNREGTYVLPAAYSVSHDVASHYINFSSPGAFGYYPPKVYSTRPAISVIGPAASPVPTTKAGNAGNASTSPLPHDEQKKEQKEIYKENATDDEIPAAGEKSIPGFELYISLAVLLVISIIHGIMHLKSLQKPDGYVYISEHYF